MRRHPRHRPDASVRIIGGRWRRRRIAFPPDAGVRPTPDRVRETVFNWLEPGLAGARCLDLFAGSGALGLEAASRGAPEVYLLDDDARICRALGAQVERLGASAGGVIRVVHADALAWLAGPRRGGVGGGAQRRFDVVFVDPPYRTELLGECARLLQAKGWLAPGARVYLESAAPLGAGDLPRGWTIEREKRAGRVRYYLASAG